MIVSGDNNVLVIFALIMIGSLLPVLTVSMTSFVKIGVVLFVVRNALGIQQTPPNMLLYGMALIMTFYVMAPIVSQIYAVATDPKANYNSIAGFERTAIEGAKPVRAFLTKHTNERDRAFFIQAAEKVWGPAAAMRPAETDLVVLVPSFLSAELTRAFEIAFLLYLPFVMIDFAVSAILVALGMQMMSPTVISTPLKLLLFVLVDGWTRLLQGLVLSYA